MTYPTKYLKYEPQNMNQCTRPDPPVERSLQVSDALDAVEREGAWVHESLANLAERLIPVLSLPTPVDECGKCSIDNEPMCPLAARLAGVRANLAHISAAVADLLRRLEV